MLHWIRITAAVCCLPSLLTAQEKKTEGFVYESDHHCKITFPVEPRPKDVNRQSPHLHKRVQISVYATYVVADGQRYRLALTPHPDAPPQVNQKDQEYFDDFLDHYNSTMKVPKYVTNKKFEFGPNKLQARDYVVKDERGITKGRLIMREKQLIFIEVGSSVAKFDEKKANAFIESFEFYLPQAKPKK